MTAPLHGDFSTRFTPEQWNGKKPAYASGGPLNIPEDAPRTLTEALLRLANQEDRGIIYIQKDGQEDFQNYAALLREAREILGGLRRRGLQKGGRVILQIDSLRAHFTTFWACVLGGITPVTVAVAPSYREKNGVISKLFNTWNLLKNPLIITSAHLETEIAGIAEFLEMPGLETAAVESLRGGAPAQDLCQSRPEDLVFFQLTSGSTGVPKCIQETHRGIIAHIHGAWQFNGYSPDDVTFNWLPVDHVVPILTSHLKDVYIGSQQIHAKSDIVLANPLRWLDLMEKHRVTHTWSPNFGFKLVADRLAQTPARKWDLSALKFLLNAGEQVTLPVVRDFLEKTAPFGLRPQAMQPSFGMAEVCTCMTFQNEFTPETGVHRFRKDSLTALLEPAAQDDPAAITFVDLGPPVPGIEIRVTDQQNRVLPEGVVGRFQIRGPVVTPGYLYNDAANAEAFVGDGWFNSGDLGFILNGRLTLTGREKEMIIVRGANFYCYEIEDVVNGIEGVEPTFASSSAVADPDTGTEGLAIFFVPKEGRGFERDGTPSPGLLPLLRSIRAKVAASLGINPAAVIPLEKSAFPKTTSGKIQRGQMKKNFEAGEYAGILEQIQSAGDASASDTPARDELEQKLAAIWSELLPVKHPGASQNFFELGGDSLLAARVLSRVQDAFHVELPLHVLFNGGATISGMAGHIRRGARDAAPLPPLKRRESQGPAPASAQQRRLWFIDQVNPGCPAYHVATIIRFEGPLDEPALRQALNALRRRHPALRTGFEMKEGSLLQRVHEHSEMPFETRALNSPPEAVRETAWQDAKKPFDLGAGQVTRAVLYRLSKTEHHLLLVIHQIATDGWSMGILFHELNELYLEFTGGPKAALAEPPVDCADFAAWQRQWLTDEFEEKQLDYWREALAGASPELDLTPDYPRPVPQTFSSHAERHPLPANLAESLRAFARENNSTVFMVLLSAWQALLTRAAGQDDILLGTAVSARNKPELEPAVGFLVNTVPLRAHFSGNPTFATLLEQTRGRTLGAFTHQHAPFEKLVEQFHPNRGPNRPPLIQAWFGSWEPLPRFKTGQAKIEVQELFSPGAQFELSLFVIDAPEELSIVWEHNTDLFSENTIAELRRKYCELLRLLIASPEAPLQTLFAALSERELEWGLERQASARASLRSAKRRPLHAAP